MKGWIKLVACALLAVSAVFLTAQESDPWNAGEALGARPAGPTSPASPREVNPVTPMRPLNARPSVTGDDMGVDGAKLDDQRRKARRGPLQEQTASSLCFQPGLGWVRRDASRSPEKSEGAAPVTSRTGQESRPGPGQTICPQLATRSSVPETMRENSFRTGNGTVGSPVPPIPSLRTKRFTNREAQGKRSPIKSVVPPVAADRLLHSGIGGLKQVNVQQTVTSPEASYKCRREHKKQVPMLHAGSKRHRTRK